jgi:hypothetical protein
MRPLLKACSKKHVMKSASSKATSNQRFHHSHLQGTNRTHGGSVSCALPRCLWSFLTNADKTPHVQHPIAVQCEDRTTASGRM